MKPKWRRSTNVSAQHPQLQHLLLRHYLWMVTCCRMGRWNSQGIDLPNMTYISLVRRLMMEAFGLIAEPCQTANERECFHSGIGESSSRGSLRIWEHGFVCCLTVLKRQKIWKSVGAVCSMLSLAGWSMMREVSPHYEVIKDHLEQQTNASLHPLAQPTRSSTINKWYVLPEAIYRDTASQLFPPIKQQRAESNGTYVSVPAVVSVVMSVLS